MSILRRVLFIFAWFVPETSANVDSAKPCAKLKHFCRGTPLDAAAKQKENYAWYFVFAVSCCCYIIRRNVSVTLGRFASRGGLCRIFFLSNLFDALRFICFPWFLSDTIDGIPQNFSCLLIIHGSKKCSSVTPRRFPILVGINNLEALMRYTLCVRCCERKFGNHWFQYIEIETISHKKMLRIRNEVLRFPQLCFKYYNDPRCLILVLKLKALLQLPAHLFEIIIKLLKHLHIERFGGFTSLSKLRFRGIFRQDPQLMYTFTNESSRWMFIWIKIFLSPLCYHQLESTFVSGRSKKGRIARDEEEFKKCFV